MDDEICKLAAQLAEASESREGARLEPKSVLVALAALRACRDKRPFPRGQDSPELFQIELVDSLGSPGQVLAVIRDAVTARAAFEAAQKQNPNRTIVLRRPRMSEPV
jgi:hypothetical protein